MVTHLSSPGNVAVFLKHTVNMTGRNTLLCFVLLLKQKKVVQNTHIFRKSNGAIDKAPYVGYR